MAGVDVPYQEFVIQGWYKGLLIFQSEDALGPPPDRMQGMLIPDGEDIQIEFLQQVLYLLVFVDPYMAARCIMVVI